MISSEFDLVLFLLNSASPSTEIQSIKTVRNSFHKVGNFLLYVISNVDRGWHSSRTKQTADVPKEI